MTDQYESMQETTVPTFRNSPPSALWFGCVSKCRIHPSTSAVVLLSEEHPFAPVYFLSMFEHAPLFLNIEHNLVEHVRTFGCGAQAFLVLRLRFRCWALFRLGFGSGFGSASRFKRLFGSARQMSVGTSITTYIDCLAVVICVVINRAGSGIGSGPYRWKRFSLTELTALE